MELKTGHINSSDHKLIFEQLFKNYFTPLSLFARKYLQDMDVSKDIVHNVFIELWEKRETIDFNKSMKSYLFTSVHNRSMNYIRDNKKFTRDETQLSNIDKDLNDDSNESGKDEELEEKLNSALNALPEKCREVFELSRFEGLKYNDIAERLNISVKTVETQMTKALKILREHLKELLMCLVLWILSRM